MSSLDSAMIKAYQAQSTVGRVVDDTPVAFRIVHTDASAAVTSVTVTTATNIVLIDADGTSTITFATYDNMGKVVDAINALDNWDCVILDALRADASASVLVDGAITSSTLNGEVIWDALVDTSAAVFMTYRCAYSRNVNATRPKGGHRVKLQEFTYNVNIGTAAANKVRVYEWDNINKTETQIWQAASVDATSTTHNFASGNGMITAGYGNDLIVRITDAATMTDAAANHLQCVYIRE